MSLYYANGYPDVMAIIGGIFSGISLSVGLIFSILIIVGMWKMFEKAGEAGWTSLIPFVNMYKLYKIGWGCGWLFLLSFVPIVNVIFGIVLAVKLSKAYGMGGWFALGLIFLPSIFYIILGFGDSRYYGPER